MVELRQGEYYKTRDGRDVYCIGECPFYKITRDSFVCSVNGTIQRYFPNGNWMAFDQGDDEYDWDIIE